MYELQLWNTDLNKSFDFLLNHFLYFFYLFYLYMYYLGYILYEYILFRPNVSENLYNAMGVARRRPGSTGLYIHEQTPAVLAAGTEWKLFEFWGNLLTLNGFYQEMKQ